MVLGDEGIEWQWISKRERLHMSRSRDQFAKKGNAAKHYAMSTAGRYRRNTIATVSTDEISNIATEAIHLALEERDARANKDLASMKNDFKHIKASLQFLL
ncbi:hypothetical protein BDZ89DRAFT_1146931 [Hymenopellis radicata]|nr:hypothetical protein BDZ89DRAFT_1146931 [Hymenopellis radicata]